MADARIEPLRPPEVSQGRGWRLRLIVAAVLGLGVLAGILWLGRPGSEPSAPPVPDNLPPLSPEAEAYIGEIEISRLELSRWENLLGQTVTYLDANLTNRGTRSVVALELAIEFLDPYERVVLRDTLRPIGAARPSPTGRPTGPLAPGETRSFRASFEHLPANWNRRPPRTRITGLLLD